MLAICFKCYYFKKLRKTFILQVLDEFKNKNVNVKKTKKKNKHLFFENPRTTQNNCNVIDLFFSNIILLQYKQTY